MSRVFTIGFSNQPFEQFVSLAKRHDVTAIADVRSTPISRYTPQFDKPRLASGLRDAGITYVFLGKELGARPSNLKFYDSSGRLDWDRFSKSELFRSGLTRSLNGADRFNLALACTEKDPLDCHRCLLVAQNLFEQGIEVKHILQSGEVETHADSLLRLRRNLNLDQPTLLDSEQSLTQQALKQQENKIAYQLPKEQP